jgi:hypothetical protein
MKTPAEKNPNELNEEKGVSLQTPHTLSLNAQMTTPVAYNWYVFLITQKELHVKNNKVHVKTI